MYKTMITLIVSVLLCSVLAAEEINKLHDFDKAVEAAREQKKPLLIDFYFETCTYCNQMDTTTFKEPEVVSWLNENVIFVKVNGKPDNKTPTEFAKKWGVKGYPTFILAGYNGAEIDRTIGYSDKDTFLKTMHDYIVGKNTLQDYLMQDGDGASSELLFTIADKFQWRGSTEQAEQYYDRVLANDPEMTDTLSREAMFRLADMARRDYDFDLAISRFEQVYGHFHDHVYGQYALVYQAICYRDKGETEQAIAAFERYLKEYPEGEDVDYSNRQIQNLKAKLAEKASG